MQAIEKYKILIILFLFPFLAMATHNRAGEITYIQTDNYSIDVTVTTYTKLSSVQADRDSIWIDWGDGTGIYIGRTNGNGVSVGNNTKLNIYQGSYTYPGASTYTISVKDPNRVSNILNVNNSNSENIEFYIETTFTFTNLNFQGTNSSVQLLQSPIDIACVGKVFKHLPNPYDIDGDSIGFELITPLQSEGLEVPNYVLPNQIFPGVDNSFSFNENTGEIIWNSPQKGGEYNLAFRVNEYRDGVLITSMIRDMQIFVIDCNNDPPVIETIDDICVVAGEIIEFELMISDPNLGQLVKLEATGAPFLIEPNSASLNVSNDYMEVPFIATFEWKTRCEDISDNVYQVVFRAVDNYFNESAGLADLQSVNIKVVGPAPENLKTTSKSNSIELLWESPYTCEITDDNYFQGFTVWRKESTIMIDYDDCNPGLSQIPAFKKLNVNTQEMKDGKYFFEDTEIEKGKTYCYRVQAEFAKLSPLNFPFNIVESLPSNEVCDQTLRDIPVLLKADILSTEIDNGEIFLKWTRPNPIELDTITYHGPYKYILQRSTGIDGDNFENLPSSSITTPNFSNLIDTTFIDNNLNTINQGYNYRIAFYTNGNFDEVYDYSPTSSTIFLKGFGASQSVDLSWDFNTSWFNHSYNIYQVDNASNILVESVDEQTSTITNLLNEVEYCYYVESEGGYSIDDLSEEIINRSNIVCIEPIDTIPPCSPLLSVTNPCEYGEENLPEEDYINILSWNDVRVCSNSSDVIGYNLYVYSDLMADAEFLAFVDVESARNYSHRPSNSLVSCYSITAIDSFNNESSESEKICISDCPRYILPNTFTPNGDFQNDLFRPILSRFVSKVEFYIFDERGVKIFETENPDINWDGTNYQNNSLPDGVYYYTCTIYQKDFDGSDKRYGRLSGYIQLLNMKN